MKPIHFKVAVLFAAVACGASAAASACGATNAPPPTQVSVVKPPVPLPISINALMVAQVDHASHELWNAGKEGHAPKTDQEWEEIEHHAMQLAAAATLVSLGGNGQADPGWVVKQEWKPFAQKLSDTAMRAVNAAHAKDLQGLLKAGDDLTDVCEGCHKAFKPQIPSEGIVHPHYRQ
jgi:hypothetical protein